MKKLFELRQQKTALKYEMRTLLTVADGEKRSLNDEEGKKFDELRGKVEALDIEITRLDAVQDEDRNLPGTQLDGKAVTNEELRTYILTGERRALSTAVGADGGYTVIPELDKEIMRQLQDDSVMRSIATVKTTKTNEYQKLVSVGGSAVDGTALADTIQKARGIPSQWVEMLTKRFNIWCQGATPWMGSGTWDACREDYGESDLTGMECYAGLDLSSTGDITSVCYAFPSDREIRLLTRHYLPEAQLNNVANKNRAIYRQWAKAGWIRTTPGDGIDYDRIRDDILRDAEVFGIKLVGFDTWNTTHLRTQLQGAGLDVGPFPQTYLKFSPVAKSLEVFINRKVIWHNGEPVLAWAIGNVVMESDANANIKPNKKKSANKIVPAIAALMAFGTWQTEHEDFAFNMSASHKLRLAEFNGV